jgi:hypothetical protein
MFDKVAGNRDISQLSRFSAIASHCEFSICFFIQ